MQNSTPPTSKALLSELASISTMQRGTLAEEYRQGRSADGKGTVRLGPYFKHQCWQDGRNQSRRVPAHEAPLLREDIANGLRFDAITEQLAAATIAHTCELRSTQRQALSEEKKESKKNSIKLAPKPCSPKQRASSPKRSSK